MSVDQIASLAPLPGPYEIVDLSDGQALTIRPESFLLGRVPITPRDGRPTHEIAGLRLTVSAADKPTLPRYWDLTSKHAVAGMLGYLQAPGGLRRTYKLTKHGKGPASRYTLDVSPPV